MTDPDPTVEPVHYEKDRVAHVAWATLDNPGKLNALHHGMYERLLEILDDVENDDAIKVLVLRGAGDTFTSGQDLSVAYSWYDADTPPEQRPRRPSQTRRLSYDKQAQRAYHALYRCNKVLLASVQGHALGGGLEFLLSADLSVVAHGTRIGMPAARFLGPVIGNLHLFFHRLGPTLAKDLLLTGRIADAADAVGAFTRFVPPSELEEETDRLARLVARMPADGIAIAKSFFRLVEEQQGLAGSEITEHISHAFGSNLGFRADEYNFVKIRAKVGTSKAFELRDRYFEGGESLEDLDL